MEGQVSDLPAQVNQCPLSPHTLGYILEVLTLMRKQDTVRHMNPSNLLVHENSTPERYKVEISYAYATKLNLTPSLSARNVLGVVRMH